MKNFKEEMINWKEWNKFTNQLDKLARAPKKLMKGHTKALNRKGWGA